VIAVFMIEQRVCTVRCL